MSMLSGICIRKSQVQEEEALQEGKRIRRNDKVPSSKCRARCNETGRRLVKARETHTALCSKCFRTYFCALGGKVLRQRQRRQSLHAHCVFGEGEASQNNGRRVFDENNDLEQRRTGVEN